MMMMRSKEWSLKKRGKKKDSLEPSSQFTVSDFSVFLPYHHGYSVCCWQNKKVCCCTVQVFTPAHIVRKKKKKKNPKGFMGMWITVNVSFKRDRFSEQDFIFWACNCEVQPCQNNESFFFWLLFWRVNYFPN